eukprot:Rhum_TRINITY_DN14424_c16_g1::Rhum_TRINITY_DN14424_c16_g1_i1::g.89171::m.89171
MKPSSKGGKERPVVLVHDCDAVWALVEDQFADGPMLNHPSLITIPNGGRYILRKLLYNFVVEAAAPTEYVFTPDRHIHRTPFLHIKLVNVDLVTDVRAKRTELLKWAERLEREEYLIILMHPTLVQQPVQAARPSKDEKKSALDIMFSRRSPLEQAKHKLAETEARLKEKFKRVYTLWHAKDARDLFVEVRACVISTFNCRLQHSLNVAARLKNQWTKNKLSTAATNICPYVSVMDDVAGLLMKFGLSVEVSACYERLAAVLHALSSDFASASFVSVPSTYTPDPSHFCSLFTIDTANPKFAALTKRLKDCEIEALQNATPPSSPSCAAEGPAAVTATTPPPSELDVRIFSFVRHVSACLHHEAALGTEGPAKALAMFSRGFLPRVAKVLRARGVSAGAQTGTELALQIAFANMLSQLGKGFVGFGTASSPPVPPTQAQPEPAAVAAAAAAATAAAAPAAEAAEAAAAAATATTGVSSDAGSDDASSVDDAAEAQPDTADAASRSNAGASPSPPPTPTAAPAPAPSADGRQTPPDAAVVPAPNGERRRRALLRDSKEVYKALHKAYIDLVLQAKCTYVVLGRQYGCNVPADVRHVSSSDMKEGQATAAPKLTQVWVAAASSEEDDGTSPCPLGFEALRNQEAFTAAHLQFCLHAMHHCESAGRVHTQHTLVREALPCFAACGYVAPCVSLLQSQISYYDTHGWSRLATEARSKLVTLLQGLVPLIAEQDPALAAVVVGSSAGPEERQRGFARLLRLWGTSLLQLLDSGGGGGSVPGSSETRLPSSMQKQHWDWLLSAGDLFGQTMNVTFPLSPFATLLSVELSTDAPATASENNGIAACVACRVQLAAALLEGVAVRAELQLHNTEPSGGRSLILTCDRVTIRAADDDDAAASVLSVSCKGEPVGTGTYSGGLLRLLFKREEGSSVADIVVQHTFSSGVAAARGATPECDDAGGAPTCTGVHKLFDGEVLSTASEKRPRSVRWDDGAVSSDHADGPTPRSRRPSTRKAGQKDDAAARWHKTPSSPAPRATRSAEVFENNERILENVIVRITPRFWAEHCRLSLACCSVIAPEHRFSNTEDVLVLALRKTTAFGNAPLTGLQGERLSLTLRDGSQTEVSLGGKGPAGAALVGLLVVEASPAPDTPPPLVAEAGEGFSVEVADATDRSTLLRFDTQEYLQPAPVSLCSTLQVVATAEHPTAVFLVYLAQSPEAEREQHWDVVLPLMPTVYNQMLSVSFVYHLRRRFEVPPLLCSMLEMQIPFTQAFACTLHVKCNEGLVHVQVMLVNQIQSDLVLLGFTPSFGGYDEQAITGDDEGPSGAYKIVRRPQEQAAGTLLKPGDSACRVFTLAADTADTEKTVTSEDCCLYVSARYVLADSDDECVNTFRCGKSTWDVPKQETIAASIDLVGSAAGDAVVARPLRFEVAVRLVDADAAAHYSVSLSFPLTQWLIVGYLRRRIVLTADCPTAAFSVHLAPIAHGNIQAPTIKIAPLNTPTSFVSVRVRQSHSRVLVRRPS